jgi:hypothetical protein
VGEDSRDRHDGPLFPGAAPALLCDHKLKRKRRREREKREERREKREERREREREGERRRRGRRSTTASLMLQAPSLGICQPYTVWHANLMTKSLSSFDHHTHTIRAFSSCRFRPDEAHSSVQPQSIKVIREITGGGGGAAAAAAAAAAAEPHMNSL